MAQNSLKDCSFSIHFLNSLNFPVQTHNCKLRTEANQFVVCLASDRERTLK